MANIKIIIHRGYDYGSFYELRLNVDLLLRAGHALYANTSGIHKDVKVEPCHDPQVLIVLLEEHIPWGNKLPVINFEVGSGYPRLLRSLLF